MRHNAYSAEDISFGAEENCLKINCAKFTYLLVLLPLTPLTNDRAFVALAAVRALRAVPRGRKGQEPEPHLPLPQLTPLLEHR